VPSGAIAGLDGVKGARVGEVTSVTMETRKPPRGLAGAPFIDQQQIDLDAITTETLIFEGPADGYRNRPPAPRSRGSSTSRRASPSMLKPKTASEMASPG